MEKKLKQKFKNLLDNNSLTIMLIPHFSGKSIFSLKIKRWFLYSFLITLLSIFIIFSLSIFYSSNLTKKLVNYSALKEENKFNIDQIGVMKKQVSSLDTELKQLTEKDKQLRNLLGISDFKDSNNSAATKKKKLNSNYSTSKEIEQIQDKIDSLNLAIENRIKSYNSLKEKVKSYQARFAHTPSILPVNGRLGSPYGQRRHPLTRVWQMHTGQDFPTWYGAPIRATAQGNVEKVEWMGGYGLTVVVNHGYGLKTLYAHCSRTLINPGAKVKKGQIIAEAGSTGVATGVHLHYEVIKNGNPVRPNPYFNLDLFTAAKKIW